MDVQRIAIGRPHRFIIFASYGNDSVALIQGRGHGGLQHGVLRMIERTEPTYIVDIYMAGDISRARQVCREFCFVRGFCVTIAALDFTYTGGEEAGFRIGCINYPRFPSSPDDLWSKAYELATILRRDLCQHSFSMVAPDKTLWNSTRE